MAKQNKKVNTKPAKSSKEDNDAKMPLTKKNYYMMLIGVALIVIGFILMAGPRNSDPAVFDESMFNFRRITLAPIFVLGGFGFEIYAIMKRFDRKK